MDSSKIIIEGKLKAAADVVAQRYQAFFDDPDDPETNHKLRVSIRTLRSLVDFIAPWQRKKQNARMQKNLKRVVGRTSRLRELDVLAAMVEQAGCSDELMAFCRERAAAERAAVIDALGSRKLVRALEDALDETHAIAWRKGFRSKGPKSSSVCKRFRKLADSLRDDLAGLDETDYEMVHDVRKRAKQVRYVAEQFPEILGDEALVEAKQMKAEQDRLGAICDERVNREIVASFIAQEDLSPALADELRRIAPFNAPAA